MSEYPLITLSNIHAFWTLKTFQLAVASSQSTKHRHITIDIRFGLLTFVFEDYPRRYFFVLMAGSCFYYDKRKRMQKKSNWKLTIKLISIVMWPFGFSHPFWTPQQKLSLGRLKTEKCCISRISLLKYNLKLLTFNLCIRYKDFFLRLTDWLADWLKYIDINERTYDGVSCLLNFQKVLLPKFTL